ncbi:MAG: PEP/pyruvate-binding domain-containing protein [Steroidobacteraceae bacterium]
MHILRFSDEACVDRTQVGGKAANLGVLTRADFPVPRGFVVARTAYDDVIADRLRDRIAALLAVIDHANADSVEEGARRIRELIAAAPMPAPLTAAIVDAYAALGPDRYVAVRSSGTAEDLADASFAGQHDTYLDMQGAAVVLDAVKRCWASLWTARAVAYRHANGFDQLAVSLAVVVQEMVEAEVAGVMFTANPLTMATDRIVVNASWGLGEGVVSGILTPDQFTLDKNSLRLLHTVTGAKERRVVRNPATGRGTVTEPVPEDLRGVDTLTEEQLAALAEIGRRVEQHYGGMPQDIEWAFAKGSFHLLQARDITGVEFAWDEDVDAWQKDPDEPGVVWTRGFADEFWTGAVTPLFYSVRAREFTDCQRRAARIWGLRDLAATRRFRYHKAEVYLSTKSQGLFVHYTVPRMFRSGPAVDYFPPSIRTELAARRFPLVKYLWMHARIVLVPEQRIPTWMGLLQDYLDHRTAEADGLDAAKLRALGDDELLAHIAGMIAFTTRLLDVMWTGFLVHGAAVLYLLGAILAKWYDGGNAMVYADLITGLPKRTITLEENLDLWELAERIRKSPELLALFHACNAKEFFRRLREHPAGADAAAQYDHVLKAHGHRGHADRDFWFTRRAEDPAVDYRALEALLSSAAGAPRPDAREPELVKMREAATADVIARLRRRPFGRLRVRIFESVLAYALRFLVIRDDERHYIDRATYAKKRAFEELGRRLVERGLLADAGDHYFLTYEELLELFAGRAPQRLVAAKVRGRRRQFERFHAKQYLPPLYLRDGEEYREDAGVATVQDGALLAGIGTSRGTVTGTARVVHDLEDIGRVRAGEILVTNSTDPGWTPVFAVISGLVLETGGMLAHGSCLSREYGLPAVTVANATRLIPDGATITVDGSTGQVSLVTSVDVSATPPPASAAEPPSRTA